ncbi:alpha/beta fold hydrolase [Pseudidiomarina insulisalsae]|uniref:Alpha/beta hydrolase n=1 Tax=Pseudidiomarina insulisalsae TaxID=575789 RepID=A0A432YQV2_9GAMM|nr:alpha/beta hydrolase [Pseudidiomarina insulisalsae]RUO63629.1 alpha/beta hydrolase [Pseudidiomarina insulisalsae]
MKKWFVAIVVLVLLGWGATFHPATGQWVYQTVSRVEATLYGFQAGRVALSDLTFSLYRRQSSRPDAPTLLLLHGYTGSKNLWLRFANQLGDDYHLIIPDLAGHGDTGFDPQWSYSPSAQANRLQRLLDALKVDKAVLMGNSMGGLIAANFELMYPQRTQALVLLDPAGVDAPVPSRAEKLFQQGQSAFEIDNWQDFQEFYSMTMAEPPYIPEFVLRGIAQRYQEHKAEYVQIAEDFRNHDQLDGRLNNIQSPTLIIWGSADQILDASVANKWAEGIDRSELTIMQGVGHMPMVERPQQTAERVKQFLNSLQGL